MSLPINSHSEKLIHKILSASGPEEVQRLIDAALMAFEKDKFNHVVMARFIERMINDLDLFDPMKEESLQWSNIKYARILCYRIKNDLTAQPI